jgi:hypothetical protein
MNRLLTCLSYCAVALLALVIYFPSLHFDFAFDDILQITHNPQITVTEEGAANLFFTPSPPGNLYRPLTLLTYKLQFNQFGLDPEPFHALNVLLFVTVAILVYAIALCWLKKQSIALLATAFYVAHPIHSETVANIIGRAELLAAMFGLICCLLFRAAYLNTGVRSILLTCCAAITLLLASLSKESALTFVMLAPLFVWATCPQPALKRLVQLSPPLLFAVMANIGLRYNALKGQLFIANDSAEWIENPLLGLPFSERLIPAIKIIGDYLSITIAPVHQSADYSQTREQLFSAVYSTNGAFSLAMVLIFILLALRLRKHSYALGAAWFFIAFALTANIISPIGTIMGERLAFTPLIGASLFFVGALTHLLPSRAALTQILLSSMVALFAFKTSERIHIWSNNSRLFSQLHIDRPQSAKVHYLVAVENYIEYANSEVAEKNLRRALEIFPDYLLAQRLMADIMLERKDYGRAVYWYKRILLKYPEQEDVRANLARIEAAFAG